LVASLLWVGVAAGQGLAPSTPAKEYIRFGGQVIAIENATPPGALMVSPGSLVFAAQNTGTASAGQSIVLTNSGGTALTVASVGITGANPGDFSETNNCASASLTPNGTCSVTVTFTPSATGGRAASLSIAYNAAGSPQAVALSGTGTSAGSCSTPTALTTYVSPCGAVPSFTGLTQTLPLRVDVPGGVGTLMYVEALLTSSSGTFTVLLNQSGGSYTLVITDSNGHSAPSPNLSLTPGTTTTPAAPVSIPGLQLNSAALTIAGNEVQLNVSLTQTGNFSDQVFMQAQAASGYSVPWSSVVAAQWSNGPGISLTPAAEVPFYGSQNVGTASAAQTVTLANSGTSAVTITSITTSGTNPDDFSVRSDECPSSLAAGASCPIKIVFTPSADGTRSASLRVQDNAPGSPQTIVLAGTGAGSEAPPTVLTTYVGVWGDPVPAYNGATVMLPLRLYSPAGFSTLGYLQTTLQTPGGGYNIYLFQSGGAYTFEMQDTLGHAAPWPYLSLTPNGQTTPQTTVAVPGMSVTATRLAIVGYELQLDLTLTTSGSFSYNVEMGATTGAGTSVPWFGVGATWGN
jgi:hypothetical protein